MTTLQHIWLPDREPCEADAIESAIAAYLDDNELARIVDQREPIIVELLLITPYEFYRDTPESIVIDDYRGSFTYRDHRRGSVFWATVTYEVILDRTT